MTSQCEPPSVWGSALTMRVQGFRTVINQKGRHQGQKLLHAEYTESERCPLEIGRDFVRKIYQDGTVAFEVQQESDRLAKVR
jgi:hypothetical protein